MKTIGLIGGMSWESTALYYRYINEGVKRQLGGFHSARVVLVSVDFQEIESLQHQGDWQSTAIVLSEAARQVERAGADMLLICTNTMHKVANEIAAAVNIPLLHLADATAREINNSGMARVGLLGTRFTMEQAFYRERLEQHGISVCLPGPEDRELIHRVIYRELCQGKIEESSRDEFLRVIKALHASGAEGVIEGCTEIAMLVQQADTSVPIFDTTKIHADYAVKCALS